MELKLVNGDYVPDGTGDMCRLTGGEAVLARVLYRLRAKRGGMPFLPRLGSQLYRVMREKPSTRQVLCSQYVAEALEDEADLTVTGVTLNQTGDEGELTVYLTWQGEALSVNLEL